MLIQPLAWELPCAVGTALKRKEKKGKERKRKEKKRKEKKNICDSNDLRKLFTFSNVPFNLYLF